jgi:hypothetical protein
MVSRPAKDEEPMGTLTVRVPKRLIREVIEQGHARVIGKTFIVRNALEMYLAWLPPLPGEEDPIPISRVREMDDDA